MNKNSPIISLRNLGPAMASPFERAGIHTAEEIIALGADAAYAALIESGTRPHFIGYYALVMDLQGRAWNDLDPAEKKTLRLRFDQIVSARKPAADNKLEEMLNRIGVIDQQK